MIYYTNNNQTKERKAKGEKCNTKATITPEYGKYSTMNEYIFRIYVLYLERRYSAVW